MPISENLSFRLPLESEWIVATGKKTNIHYPWQQFHSAVTRETISTYANTYEAELHRTTPVCMYPDGKSVTELMDMSGNVWEWQANQHSKGKLEFVLRGGAWSNSWEAADLETRICDFPDGRVNSCGFRVLMYKETKRDILSETKN